MATRYAAATLFHVRVFVFPVTRSRCERWNRLTAFQVERR